MKFTAKDLTLDEKILLLVGKDGWSINDLNGKLPKVRMSDGPNGLRYISDVDNTVTNSTAMPNVSSLANTWNKELAYLMGETIADECVENGVEVLLAPGVNIKRTPVCGRNFEYFSEDPVLAGELAKSYVKGVQDKGVSATVKHFCLNNREYNRTSQSSEVDERTLREIYLPAFEKALEAKPWAMMCAYNPINGVYAAENRAILKDLLRGEMGYDGLMMSDWCAVRNSWRSIKATLDLEMPLRYKAYDELKYAIEKGYITEEEIDERVETILRFVYKVSETEKKVEFTKAERHANAVKIATESMVLLKNDGVLPIKSGKIAVGGSNALGGGGSAYVKTDYVEKPLEDLLNEKLEGKGVANSSAMRIQTVESNRQSAFYKLAYDSDYAVIVVKTDGLIEGEGFDRETLKLTNTQLNVIKNTAKYCDKVIVVLSSGAPIDVSDFESDVCAIIQGGYAGECFNEALSDILTGKVSPSGKLAETYPLSLEDVPSLYEGDGFVDRYGEGVFVGYRYYDTFGVPVAYPFGHGLSYAEFIYSDLKVEKIGKTDLKVAFKVKNASKIDAKEVCQLYVKDVFSMVSRPEKELKAFEKISLKAGEEKKVEFTLSYRDFAYYSVPLKRWYVEEGDFEIFVGSSSKDIRLKERVNVELDEEDKISLN
ncbi:MAG: glycoside hydrolase family 3 C-terminal domain-containing protein [Clostridia bacterium]|nr:glycoside hydrolase family 3 C-terminal domain-containing protein [Clostridia bacterium]